jgi:hypothetical protein
MFQNYDTWYLDYRRSGQSQNLESLQIYHGHQALQEQSFSLDNTGRKQPIDHNEQIKRLNYKNIQSSIQNKGLSVMHGKYGIKGVFCKFLS